MRNMSQAFSEDKHMTSECQKYFLEAIHLSEKLIKLAHDANASCDDDRCLVVLGIILDSASKIRLESNKMLKTLDV